MNTFSNLLISWYQVNKRDLPWRNTTNPYFIWLSEIILQQTRVEQGLPYYENFIRAFPTVTHLAKANNEKVMKLWQGLGYYSRARNLHATANTIEKLYNGIFPENYNEIISLKGIGEYTAAAIASFSYNLPFAVVDGNVYRVLARVFGINTPINSIPGKKQFTELATKLLDHKNPGIYNQAIMEFGAMQCKPVKPLCYNCVLQSMCYAYEHNKIHELPVKLKLNKTKNRYLNYVLIHEENGNVIMRKRTDKDIWINLYDFPLIESDTLLTDDDFLNSEQWKKFSTNQNYSILSISKIHKHILTHQKIHARFIEIKLNTSKKYKLHANTFSIPLKNIKKYAVPILIHNYMMTKKLV